jgi:hypothetical protein
LVSRRSRGPKASAAAQTSADRIQAILWSRECASKKLRKDGPVLNNRYKQTGRVVLELPTLREAFRAATPRGGEEEEEEEERAGHAPVGKDPGLLD